MAAEDNCKGATSNLNNTDLLLGSLLCFWYPNNQSTWVANCSKLGAEKPGCNSMLGNRQRLGIHNQWEAIGTCRSLLAHSIYFGDIESLPLTVATGQRSGFASYGETAKSKAHLQIPHPASQGKDASLKKRQNVGGGGSADVVVNHSHHVRGEGALNQFARTFKVQGKDLRWNHHNCQRKPLSRARMEEFLSGKLRDAHFHRILSPRYLLCSHSLKSKAGKYLLANIFHVIPHLASVF